MKMFVVRRIAALTIGVWLAPALHGELMASLDASVPSPRPVGTLVKWTATVTGSSSSSYWYRFSAHEFDQQSRIVKDFGPDNTFEWVPSEREGFYTIEAVVINKNTGETATAVADYQVTSNVTSEQPVITATPHPLVVLYSAPACTMDAVMTVYFLGPDNRLHNAPPKQCDGTFSMNFYIAGLRPETEYFIKHVIRDGGSMLEGPVMTFTAGSVPPGLPAHSAAGSQAASLNRPVFLAGSLVTNFVATDLEGNLIWYYPHQMTFLTYPDRGGYFFAINEDETGDQSKQIVRLFDLAGVTVLETNAARVNEQLTALGRRPINAFHHDARRLSNGNIVVLAGVEQIVADAQGPGLTNILGDMIIVLNQDLEVVWTWDTFDHMDVKRMATQGEKCSPQACPPLFLLPDANDWVHGNAVAETPDGNLLYSARSQDWVMKIDYQNGSGSGAVLWRLGKDGDFRIDSSDPNPWFSHQHDPEFEADGTLSIFDNGNIRRASDPNANSRGQVYRLGEVTRVAELLMNADLGHYAFALGSAQGLENGNYIFDAGFRMDGTGISVEVDPCGNPVYSIQSTAPEYRTFRMKDMYTP
jgi:hypothetical protein